MKNTVKTKTINKAKKWLWLIKQLPCTMCSYVNTVDANVQVRITREYLKFNQLQF